MAERMIDESPETGCLQNNNGISCGREAGKKGEVRKKIKTGRKKGAGGEKGAPVPALWALLAGSSVYKVLGTAAAMAAAEALLFAGYRKTWSAGYGRYDTLTDAVESGRISLVFLAALGLTLFILARTEKRMESKSSGTMLRLRLSRSRIFAVKTAYNVFCLALLFAVQIWFCIWLAEAYGRETPEIYASPQRLFLAFYRIDFLHCLLPLADVRKWVRNGLLLLAFGTETAGGSGKTGYVLLISLYMVTASWFVSSLERNVTDGICIFLYASVIVLNAGTVWKKERERQRQIKMQ